MRVVCNNKKFVRASPVLEIKFTLCVHLTDLAGVIRLLSDESVTEGLGTNLLWL